MEQARWGHDRAALAVAFGDQSPPLSTTIRLPAATLFAREQPNQGNSQRPGRESSCSTFKIESEAVTCFRYSTPCFQHPYHIIYKPEQGSFFSLKLLKTERSNESVKLTHDQCDLTLTICFFSIDVCGSPKHKIPRLVLKRLSRVF
jgi:hypothetical protein